MPRRCALLGVLSATALLSAGVFFNVELKTKPSVPSGSYPLDFRLYAVKGNAEQEFKRSASAARSRASSRASRRRRLAEAQQVRRASRWTSGAARA
jgi:hypothetical protein